MKPGQDAAAKASHPSVFMALVTPFGVANGYVTVTLAYVLAAKGLSVTAIGVLVGFSVLPQTWKVLWAPLLDTTLSPKLWYVIGAVGVGVSIMAMSVIDRPAAAMPLLSALAIVSSAASSLCGMTSDAFLAYFDPKGQGRASGWSQAGNFAGTGVGGGLGLYLAQHVQAQWVSGAALALLCIACAGALPFAPAAGRIERPTLVAAFAEVLKEVWAVVKSRAGVLVIFLMLLPIGSGGIQWPSVASEWKVSADVVAVTGGVITGVVSGAAALAAGYLCDLIDRRTAYCLFGCAIALELVITAHLPRSPAIWIGAALLYQALVGACYSAYSAAVLEVIGRGAAATKFNLMASVSNVPIAIMPLVDGALHDRHGSNGMFYGEAALSVAAALLFGLVVMIWRPRKGMAAPA